MTYTASVNIEIGVDDDFHYIVTPNARRVLSDIVGSVQSGQHSFSIIGTYGTGKSSFIMALEDGLAERSRNLLDNPKVFFGNMDFEVLNVVGDFKPLKVLLATKIGCEPDDVLSSFKDMCRKAESKGRSTLVVVDEFGKVLEHAAKHDPEDELYFIQQLCELINDHRHKAILLTTLHQNFGAYAGRLTEAQKNEWKKVKGRFREVVFSEPVEQLLYLAAEQIDSTPKNKPCLREFESIYNLACKHGFISDGFSLPTAKCLYPLDPLAAQCLTVAIQRYGQNERSLFSFLSAKGRYSLHATPDGKIYSLADVYDYLTYNFYSAITESGMDATAWSIMKDALGRIENGLIKDVGIDDCIKVVKSLGLIGLLCGSETTLNRSALELYARDGLGLSNTPAIIKALEDAKIIRYASYKSKYILFEGTDIDIEDELVKATSVVPVPALTVEELRDYISPKVCLASAEYYRTGMPRYFVFESVNAPEVLVPEGEIDGYCELVFPLDEKCEEEVVAQSAANREANIYAVFSNVDEMRRRLHEIKKLQYLVDNVVMDDKIARREILSIQEFEKAALNTVLNTSLFTMNGDVHWYWKGEQQKISSRKDFNVLLSTVSADVYSGTPVIRNELFNKQKISSAICLARCNLLDALLLSGDTEDLGFSKDSFPPEKAIYYSLLKNTGIHYDAGDGIWSFGDPSDISFNALWKASCEFLESTVDRPRKVTELIKQLSARPFKLKKGFLDFWLPVFLFVKQQDFAIYGADGGYVMGVNSEVFDLLQKRPGDYSVKAFNVGGVKLEFFRKYRQFLRKDDTVLLKRDTFARTFTPFLQFYRGLDAYAKNTRRCSTPTLRFRDVLANAVDPEKAFFEDLPEALGYRGSLVGNDEFIKDYIDKLHSAIRELNACYPSLISRIEDRIVSEYGLSTSFDKYKPMLDERYSHVKRYLLTAKAKTFLDRMLAPADNAKEFIEKIASTVLDRRLEQMKDREEEFLSDTIISLFHELDRYQDISGISGDESGDRLFSFAITSNSGVSEAVKAYRLPKGQINRASEVSSKIESLLTGEANLDMCILLDIISKKIAK